jgi:putative oxidoreductase
VIEPILILAGITLGAFFLGIFLLRLLPVSRISPTGLRVVEWGCRIALAAIFIWAAFGKLQDPYGFAVDTYAYRIVPPQVATVVGIAMPAFELMAALALLTGVFWRGGAVLLGTMLLVFVVALFQAIVRGIDISCGCFGKESSPVSFWLIARNEVLFLCALFPLWMDARRRVLGPSR